MKKLALIVAAAVLLAAAGWAALWYAGRGAVAARLDAELARLRAQGYVIEHGAREIGGFPSGYEVTYRDVALRMPGPGGQAGGAYVLPWITAELSAGDVDRIVTRFPDKFRLEIPVAPAVRAENPELPARFDVEIEADGLTAALDGVISARRALTMTAASVLAVSAGPEQTSDIAVEFKGLEMGVTLPAPGSTGPVPSRLLIDRTEYAVSVSGAVSGKNANPVVLNGAVDAVRMTGTSDIMGPKDMLAALFEGTGSSSVAYQTGASETVITVPAGAASWAGTITLAAASSAGTMAIENGLVRLDAAGQANRVAVRIAAPGDAGPSFGTELRTIEVGYAVPIVPGPEMVPLTFRLALDEVAPDAALWSLIDAGGVLPHDPARLVIDIEASARVLRPLDQTGPGQEPPLELGTAKIRAADLRALGASVTARGDVVFVPPQQQPVGKVTVTLTNVMALIDKLAAAGLITPEMAQTATGMAAGLTVAGATPGARVAEVELTPEGIKVNGIALAQ